MLPGSFPPNPCPCPACPYEPYSNIFWRKFVEKYKNLSKNCLQTVIQGYNVCAVGRGSSGREPQRVRR
jgi:hypothetical protein